MSRMIEGYHEVRAGWQEQELLERLLSGLAEGRPALTLGRMRKTGGAP